MQIQLFSSLAVKELTGGIANVVGVIVSTTEISEHHIMYILDAKPFILFETNTSEGVSKWLIVTLSF